MKCPGCGVVVNSTSGKVVDSRPVAGRIRRRRLCGCGERYTTVETIVVSPRNGHRPAVDTAGFAEVSALKMEKVERQVREIYETIVRVLRPEDAAGTGMLKGLSL